MKYIKLSKQMLLNLIIVSALTLIAIYTCACAQQLNTTDKDEIEKAVGQAQSVPIDFNKKYSIAAPTEKGASQNMIFTVNGLKGGTAEVYTDEGLNSASAFMIKYLNELGDNKIHFRIAAIKCGSNANAIPDSFTLTLNINKKHESDAKQKFNDLADKLKSEYANDNAFKHQVDVVPATGDFPSQQDTEKIIAILNTLPNGIINMNKKYTNIIETFGNIGIIELTEGQFHCSTLLRSTDKAGIKNKASEISNNLKSFKIEWAAPENIG